MDVIDELMEALYGADVVQPLMQFKPEEPLQTLQPLIVILFSKARSVSESSIKMALRHPEFRRAAVGLVDLMCERARRDQPTDERYRHLKHLLEAADAKQPYLAHVAIASYLLSLQLDLVCEAALPLQDIQLTSGETRARRIRESLSRLVEPTYYPYLILLERLDALSRGRDWPAPRKEPRCLPEEVAARLPALVNADARFLRNAASHPQRWMYLAKNDSVWIADKKLSGKFRKPETRTVDSLLKVTVDMLVGNFGMSMRACFDFAAQSLDREDRFRWIRDAFVDLDRLDESAVDSFLTKLMTRMETLTKQLEQYFVERRLPLPIEIPQYLRLLDPASQDDPQSFPISE